MDVGHAASGPPGLQAPLNVGVVIPCHIAAQQEEPLLSYSMGLASLLRSMGHQVLVLFDVRECSSSKLAQRIGEEAERLQLELVGFTAPCKAVRGHPEVVSSFTVYENLKELSLDWVHFPALDGSAYYSLLARSQGTALNETAVCISLHPGEWSSGGGALSNLYTSEMLSQSLLRADVLVYEEISALEASRASLQHRTSSLLQLPFPRLPGDPACAPPRELAAPWEALHERTRARAYASDLPTVFCTGAAADLRRQSYPKLQDRAQARAASGYTLLAPPGSILVPHAVETLVRAACATDAPAVTAFEQLAHSDASQAEAAGVDSVPLILGGGAGVGFFENCLCSRLLLVRGELDPGSSFEAHDPSAVWRFAAGLAVHDQRIELVPEVLMTAPPPECGLEDRDAGRVPYYQAAPEWLQDVLSIAGAMQQRLKRETRAAVSIHLAARYLLSQEILFRADGSAQFKGVHVLTHQEQVGTGSQMMITAGQESPQLFLDPLPLTKGAVLVRIQVEAPEPAALELSLLAAPRETFSALAERPLLKGLNTVYYELTPDQARNIIGIRILSKRGAYHLISVEARREPVCERLS